MFEVDHWPPPETRQGATVSVTNLRRRPLEGVLVSSSAAHLAPGRGGDSSFGREPQTPLSAATSSSSSRCPPRAREARDRSLHLALGRRPRLLPVGRVRNTSNGRASERHAEPEPPQLTPPHLEEQRFYSELLTLCLRLSPEQTRFGRLCPPSRSFGHLSTV